MIEIAMLAAFIAACILARRAFSALDRHQKRRRVERLRQIS